MFVFIAGRNAVAQTFFDAWAKDVTSIAFGYFVFFRQLEDELRFTDKICLFVRNNLRWINILELFFVKLPLAILLAMYIKDNSDRNRSIEGEMNDNCWFCIVYTIFFYIL
jgi:hypothetical protein